MTLVNSETQSRIIAAAEELHAQNPERFPTVAEVRAISKADMNSVSSVMKQWRVNKMIPVQRIEEEAPSEIQRLAKELANHIYGNAKDQAESKLKEAELKYSEERSEAEDLRSELAAACDQLQQQLDEALQGLKIEQIARAQEEVISNALHEKVAGLERSLVIFENNENVFIAKNAELEKHIETLKADLSESKAQAQAVLDDKAKAEQSHSEQMGRMQLAMTKQDHELESFKMTNDGLMGQLMDATTGKTELEKKIIELRGQINVAEATAAQAQAHAKDLKELLDKAQATKSTPVKPKTAVAKPKGATDETN